MVLDRTGHHNLSEAIIVQREAVAMVDQWAILSAVLRNVKMLLKGVRLLASKISQTGGSTEQGLCIFVIFIVDVTNLGVSLLLQKRPQFSKAEFHHQLKDKNKKGERMKKGDRGTAVSYDVARFIRSIYSNFPIYFLSEERLVDEVIGDKIFSSKNSRSISFVGFDCEWVSRDNVMGDDDKGTFPVALLQISTPSECILIQICHLKSIPKSLTNFLENRHILKFGVGIEEDCKRLRMFGIQVCGMVDLRYLIQRCYHKADIIKFPKRYVCHICFIRRGQEHQFLIKFVGLGSTSTQMYNMLIVTQLCH